MPTLALTPKFVEILKYSPELDRLLHECFIDFDVKLRTRKFATGWEREIVEKILEDDFNLRARVLHRSYFTASGNLTKC